MSNSYRWSSQWRNSSLVLSLPGGLWSLLWLHPQPPMENSTGAPCTVWRNRLQYEVGINSSCDWLPCWQCLCKRRSWQISSHCHGIQWIVIILFLCFLLVPYLTKNFYSNPDFWIPAWWPISDGQLHCCTTQLNLLYLLQQLVWTWHEFFLWLTTMLAVLIQATICSFYLKLYLQVNSCHCLVRPLASHC